VGITPIGAGASVTLIVGIDAVRRMQKPAG
jgi:hypothetical protein